MEVIQLDDYNIYIGHFWDALDHLLKERQYTKLVVIADSNTTEHCFPVLQSYLPQWHFELITIPAGEIHKNIDTCQQIWQQMMDLGIDRKSLALNLGGGVIGDMGGFCASTFKRGFDFIQIPTTLLSQVDASIGGKLGIDFMQVKNSIGVFRNPQGVFISPDFFKTLPQAEIRSGFAEIIKHSLIADQAQWDIIENIKDLSAVNWIEILVPSLQIKKQVVEADPFEKGIRKALNFGHTIGHAIEGFALETDHPLLHGEAIAIGMVCESYLSTRQLGLTDNALQRISQFLLNTYDSYPLDQRHYNNFLHLMTKDKKNENGIINFSMIDSIGNVHVNQTASEDQIIESLDYYNSLTDNVERRHR